MTGVRRWTGLLFALVVGLAAGAFWHDAILHRLGHRHVADGGAPASQSAVQLWTCGMHPQVIRDRPGLCPICQMELTPLVVAPEAAHRTADGAGNAITIDPVVVQNMGIRVAEATRGPVRRTIRAVGYLDEAKPSAHAVNLRLTW